MASNKRRRQPPRRRVNKPKAPNPKASLESSSPIGGAAATVDDVPDHVLEVILLGLDSYVSLVRAASACKRWCRVVADAGFLSCFHPLPAQAPLILGHYYRANYQQLAFAPSSTPSIRERSRQSFSLDFVPKVEGAWQIADSRSTLLLLSNKSKKDWTTRSNPDLVVCTPLTRRYHAISVPDRRPTDRQQCLGLFLVEGGGGTGIGLSNFRVMAVLLRDHMLVGGRGVPVACVYSPGTTTTGSRKCGWRDVSCTWSGDINIPNTADSFFFAGRANGCLYWPIIRTSAALVLDEATTGVSLVDLPVPMAINFWYWYARSRCFRVIGGDGEGGAVSLRAVHLSVNDLRVYARLHVGDEWVLQNLQPLPVPENTTPGSSWDAVIVAAHETYVVVTPRDSKLLFSVDLKTMAVECVRQTLEGPAYPYELPWQPTLEAAQDNTHSSTSTSQLTGCSGSRSHSHSQTDRLVTLLYATVRTGLSLFYMPRYFL